MAVIQKPDSKGLLPRWWVFDPRFWREVATQAVGGAMVLLGLAFLGVFSGLIDQTVAIRVLLALAINIPILVAVVLGLGSLGAIVGASIGSRTGGEDADVGAIYIGLIGAIVGAIIGLVGDGFVVWGLIAWLLTLGATPS